MSKRYARDYNELARVGSVQSGPDDRPQDRADVARFYNLSSPSFVFNLAARQGYHVNPDYPMAFKPQGHSGVQFEGPNLKLTWGAKTPCTEKPEDACAVEVPIALTPENPQGFRNFGPRDRIRHKRNLSGARALVRKSLESQHQLHVLADGIVQITACAQHRLAPK